MNNSKEGLKYVAEWLPLISKLARQERKPKKNFSKDAIWRTKGLIKYDFYLKNLQGNYRNAKVNISQENYSKYKGSGGKERNV